MPAQQSRRWSAREVRDLIAKQPNAAPRYELVDGELLVTPSPTRTHQRAVREIAFALHSYVEHLKIGEVLFSPSDVEVENEQLTQPDVYVLGAAESERLTREDFPVRDLLLAIEVLSPSSARYDRVTKRRLYQRTVQEYWIVDVDARVVERWRKGDERPEVLTERVEWIPPRASQPFELDLAALFLKVLGSRQ